MKSVTKSKKHEEEKCLKRENDQLYGTKRNDSKADQPPDGGWGWFIVIASTVSLMLIEGSEKSYGLVFLHLRKQHESSSSATAIIPSLAAGLRLFLGPLGSALGTKFGCRPVVIAGGFLYLVSFLSSIAPPNLYYLYFSYGLLSGIAGALTQSNCFILVGRYFRKKMSTANGMGTAGGGIGICTFPILVQYLLENFGYTGYILISAGLMFNVVVCGALLRPLEESKGKKYSCCRRRQCDDKKETRLTSEGFFDAYAYFNSNESIVMATEHKKALQEQAVRNANGERVAMNNNTIKKKTSLLHWSLLKDHSFLLLAFSIMFTLMGNLLGLILLPALAKERNFTTSQGALLVSIIGITDVIGRLSIGAVSDISCIRPNRRHVFLGANLLMGLLLELFPLANQYSEFVILVALYGLVEGMVIAQRNVMLMDLLGIDKYASSIGFAHFFGGVGFLIGPFLGGAIKDLLGHYTYSFMFAGGMIMLGALLFLVEYFWFKYFKIEPKQAMMEMDIL